jgi:hypothetical protein
MTAAHPDTALDIYQHDSSDTLQFVLSGALTGMPVSYLEHSWITASSTLGGRALVVDVAGLREADAEGLALLSRMCSCGAKVVAAKAPVNTELARRLGIPAAAGGGDGKPFWRMLGLWGTKLRRNP